MLDRFDPDAGGLERWTVGFADHLAGAGHEPCVVAFEAAPGLASRVTFAEPARGVLERARSVAAAVARLGAEVVLDTGTGWSGDVFMPCTGSRLWSQRRLEATHPWPMRLRALVSPRSVAHRRALWALERAQVRRARRIVAVSPLVRDLLAAQHGIAADRIAVVPNGVPVAALAPAVLAPLRAGMRERLGVGERVLFLGSAHNPWLKGMDTAIRALAGLEGAMLVVAGAAADARWSRLAELAPGRVRFLGPVADMTPLFAASDALVHPTRWDACSLSTIEAGAAGLPVITTALNGAASLIADAESGVVLADPEDVGALRAAMRRLLDGAERARMSLAALARAPGQDVSVNYRRVLEVIRSVRAGDNGPGAWR